MQRSTVLRSRCRSPSKDTGRPPALPRFLWFVAQSVFSDELDGQLCTEPANRDGSRRRTVCRLELAAVLLPDDTPSRAEGASRRYTSCRRGDSLCHRISDRAPRRLLRPLRPRRHGLSNWNGVGRGLLAGDVLFAAGRTPPRSSARTWRRSLQLARETRVRARRRDRRVHDHPVSEREGAGFPRGRWQKAPDQSLHPRPRIHFRALNQNSDFSVLRQSAAPGRNGGPHHASAGAGRRTPHGSGEPVVHP